MNAVTTTWNAYKTNTQTLDAGDRWNLSLYRLFIGTLFASLLITSFIHVTAGETVYVLMAGILLFAGLPGIVKLGYQKGVRQHGKQFEGGFALDSDAALKKEYRNAAIGAVVLLVACWLPSAMEEGLDGFSLTCIAGFSAFAATWFLIRGFTVGWNRVHAVTGQETLHTSKPGFINAPVVWMAFYVICSLFNVLSIMGSPARAAAADAASHSSQGCDSLCQGMSQGSDVQTPSDQ